MKFILNIFKTLGLSVALVVIYTFLLCLGAIALALGIPLLLLSIPYASWKLVTDPKFLYEEDSEDA